MCDKFIAIFLELFSFCYTYVEIYRLVNLDQGPRVQVLPVFSICPKQFNVNLLSLC